MAPRRCTAHTVSLSSICITIHQVEDFKRPSFVWVCLVRTTMTWLAPPPPLLSALLTLHCCACREQTSEMGSSSGGKTTLEYCLCVLKRKPYDWLTPGQWRKTDNNGQTGECSCGVECHRPSLGKRAVGKCRDWISHSSSGTAFVAFQVTFVFTGTF
jgi:hypothetical protein